MRNGWRVLGGVAVLGGALLGGCGGGGGGGGGGGTSGTGLTLESGDLPAVSPCPMQGILKDQVQLDELRSALDLGTIVHMDVPYDAGDPDIFRKKAGLGSYWDPAAAVNEVGASVLPITLSGLIQFDNAGIAAAGFTSSSFGTGEGFPAAGTYHKEFKVAHMGTTWLLRVRCTVSGSSAGNTFASEGIAVPADIENTLVYEVDGNPTPQPDILNAAVVALMANGTDAPTFTLDVRLNGAGPVVFTAKVELICVEVL